MDRASHEVVEHTSELELRLRAASAPDLYAEAARALAIVLLRGKDVQPSGVPRTIELCARDAAALLVDFLNELVYLAEVERFVALEVQIEHLGPTHLLARARGATLDEAPWHVKAATLHGLALSRGEQGLVANVVFDV